MTKIDPGQVLVYSFDSANNALRISGGIPSTSGSISTPNSTASTVLVQPVTPGLVGFYTVRAVGHDPVTPNYVLYEVSGVVSNTAGTIAFSQAPITTIVADSTGGSAKITVVSGTSGTFDVKVTGLTGKTFNWNVYLQYIEA